MIEAVQCPQCGAGAAQPAHHDQRERECEYCGSILRQASPSSGVHVDHYHGIHEACPRCHHKTVDTKIRAGYLAACHHCGGIWIPLKVMRRLGKLDKRTKRQLTQLNRRKLKRPHHATILRHRSVHCPECSRVMTRKAYGKRSKVVVDLCHRHGAWFDQNELLQAHREVACRIGKQSRKYDDDDNYRYRRSWRHEPLYIIIRAIANILEEIFD